MPVNIHNVKQIFGDALAIDSPERRLSYLDEACAGDEDLRAEVEALLAAIDSAGTFIEKPAVSEMQIDSARQDPLGKSIGPYKLREQLGEGGFGVVYVAEQHEPIRRKVALKIIKPGMDSRDVIARLQAERQALALMDHPNVARVLDAGTTESGHPYFVMELVRGISITEFCDKEKLTNSERLTLFVNVCRAVQHAHQKGIIHRDIKPTNVLVTLHDGRPVPKVIDFGVAKALGRKLSEQSIYTSVGQMIGTPLYMSPEQAELSGLDVDTRSDVYSLGVLLYELLAGTTPFDREHFKQAGFDEMRRIIREDDPPRPSARISTLKNDVRATVSDRRRIDVRRLEHSLKGDLDWVVMKALEKDRERRYDSPAALADDIENYLNHEPVLACPPSISYRGRRFLYKHRFFLLTTGLIIAALGLGLWTTYQQRQTAFDALELANTRLVEVQREKERAGTLLYATDIRLSSMALAEGSIRQAIELLGRHRPHDGGLDLRGCEWHYLMLKAYSESRVLSLSDESLYTVCLTSDGSHAVASGADGVIRIIDLQSFVQVAAFQSGQTEVNYLSFSSDGRLLLSAGDNGTICIWDWESHQLIRTIVFGTEKCFSTVVDRAHRYVIACGETPQVRIFDFESAELVRSLKIHTKTVNSLSMSSDGKLLACVSSDSTHSLWEWQTGKLLYHSAPLNGRVSSSAICNRNQTLIDGSIAGEVRVSTLSSPRTRTIHRFPGQVQSLAISPDEQRLAVGKRDGTIQIADISFDRPLPGNMAAESAFQTDLGRVYSMSWQDRETLLSVGENGRLLQSAIGVDPTAKQVLPDLSVNAIAMTPDGDKLLLVINHESISEYDVRTKKLTPLDELADGHRWNQLAISPSGELLAIAANNGDVLLRRQGSSHVTVHNIPGASDLSQLTFSTNGKRLAIVSRADDRCVVLDVDTLQSVADYTLPENEWAALAPEGDFVAANNGRDLLVYNLSTGDLVKEMKRFHSEAITAIRFDPSGEWIFTCGGDRRIQRWRWQSDAKPLLIGVDKTGAPKSLALTDNGKTLITASDGGQVTLWNINAGQPLFPLFATGSRFSQVVCSQDGHSIAAMTWEGEVSCVRFPWFDERDKVPVSHSPSHDSNNEN